MGKSPSLHAALSLTRNSFTAWNAVVALALAMAAGYSSGDAEPPPPLVEALRHVDGLSSFPVGGLAWRADLPLEHLVQSSGGEKEPFRAGWGVAPGYVRSELWRTFDRLVGQLERANLTGDAARLAAAARSRSMLRPAVDAVATSWAQKRWIVPYAAQWEATKPTASMIRWLWLSAAQAT